MNVLFIVIHCSATRADRPYGVEQLRRDHKARGFRDIGYHIYVRRNGETIQTRHLDQIGAHAKGFNACSIGVCYEGGLDSSGSPRDTRTFDQRAALAILLQRLKDNYPNAMIVGHRDLILDRQGHLRKEVEEWLNVTQRTQTTSAWHLRKSDIGTVPKACPCFDALTEYAGLMSNAAQSERLRTLYDQSTKEPSNDSV